MLIAVIRRSNALLISMLVEGCLVLMIHNRQLEATPEGRMQLMTEASRKAIKPT